MNDFNFPNGTNSSIGAGTCNALVLESDGKLVLAGTDGSNFIAYRLKADGTIDSTGFGTAGKVTVSFAGAADAYAAVEASFIGPSSNDDDIILGGSACEASCQGCAPADFAFAAIRVSNGTLDTGFNGTGRQTYSFCQISSNQDADYSLAVDNSSNHRVVAAGVDQSSGSNQIGLVVLNHNGALDPTFNTSGSETLVVGTVSSAYTVAVQPADQKIVLAGTASGYYSGTSNDFVVARFNSGGSPDGTFGSNGVNVTDFDVAADTSGYDAAKSLAIDTSTSDNTIVVGGFTGTTSTGSDIALARYLPSHSLTTTSGTITLGTNFAGLHYADSGVVPPDTNVAVGPNQIVEVVNTPDTFGAGNSIAFYNKSDGSLVSEQSLSRFFSSVSPDYTDPFVRYDELAQKFVVSMCDDSGYYLDIAVSNDSNPSDGFQVWQEPIFEPSTGTTLYYGDFDKIGYNADAWVFTVYMLQVTNGGFNHDEVIALGKSTHTFYKSDYTPPTNREGGHIALEPAAMHGATSGSPMYFVEELNAASSLFDVVKMSNVLSSTPTYTDNQISVPSYASSALAPAPQPNGGGSIATDANVGDHPALNAAWETLDSVGYLVTGQNVDTNGATHARWYEFNTSSMTLAQSGEINPGPGVYTYYPAIDIDADGDLGLTYMESSAIGSTQPAAGEFMSVHVTGQKNGEAAGTMEPPVLVKAGAGTYSDGTTPPYRVGDYDGIAADPSNAGGFWAATQFANTDSSVNWGTWVTEFSFPATRVRPVSAKTGTTAMLAAAGAAESDSLGSSDQGDVLFGKPRHVRLAR